MPKIVLTGGGTAGHVMPNIALMPELLKRGYEISYIGSVNGMEKEMIEKTGTPYYGISVGKLRRYFDLKNLTDAFRVLKGYAQARKLLKKLKPDIIFSKGGFVSVPVALAGAHLHIPVIIHESDMTPGLANRISIPSAVKVCCNFPETKASLPDGKGVVTGSPIRRELFEGSKDAAYSFTGLENDKPLLLVVGGSLGAAAVNDAVRRELPQLLKDFNVVHSCGKGHLDDSLSETSGYRQYEFIGKELADIMAAADLVISRAGANAICELLAMHKPNILIPLPKGASRGDQILNAASFEKQGFSLVLPEDEINDGSLYAAVKKVYDDRESYIAKMAASNQGDPIGLISDLIDENRRK